MLGRKVFPDWENQRCGDCNFWFKQEPPPGHIPKLGEPSIGFCRSRPPSVFALQGLHPITKQTISQLTPHYPPLSEEYPACGDYEPLMKQPPTNFSFSTGLAPSDTDQKDEG